MQKIRQRLLFLGVVLLSTTALSQEIKTPISENEGSQEEWPLLQAADQNTKQYRGVATLNNDGFMCTAFVIQPSGCSAKSDKAVMMTNGHCTKALNANAVGGVRSANLKVKFGDFAGAKESEIVNASGTKVLYESMKQQDVAFIELDMTYAELEAKGIPAYKLATPTVPQSIRTVGRPIEQTPDGLVFHRQAQCSIEKNVGLIEGDWYWPKAISTNCPSQKGSSGSPMFNDKGEVVGILNTGSTNPGPSSPRCPANSPCEIGSDGKQNYVPHKTYGFETGHLNSCFQGCKWHVEAASCKVAKESSPEFKLRRTKMQTLEISSPLPTPYTNAKYKMVPLGNGDCSTAGGYEELKVSSLGIMYDSKKKDPEGKYHLCLIGGIKQSDGTVKWDAPTKAHSSNITLDRTPPEVAVTLHGDVLIVKYKDPEDAGEAGFGYKTVGSAKECANTKDYKAHKGMPLRLPQAGKILCLKAQDSAGNWQTTPTMFNSQGPL